MLGHTGSIQAIVYDPTRRYLFTGSYDGSIIVWEIPGPGSLVAVSKVAKLQADAKVRVRVRELVPLVTDRPAPAGVLARVAAARARARRRHGQPQDRPLGPALWRADSYVRCRVAPRRAALCCAVLTPPRAETIVAHAEPVVALAVDLERGLLVSGSKDCFVKLWSLPAGDGSGVV